MNLLLQLKHWQLFLLLFALPVGLEIAMVVVTLVENDPALMFSVFPWLIGAYLILLFGWFWTMGHFLHAKLPESVQMNLNYFRISILFPAVYILVFIVFIFRFIGQIQDPESFDPENMPNPLMFLAIAPLHLVSIFCLFYCLYFISKSLKAVDLQRDVTLSDYIGEFALIWFWPVGIWFIQPKINKLFSENEAGNANIQPHP